MGLNQHLIYIKMVKKKTKKKVVKKSTKKKVIKKRRKYPYKSTKNALNVATHRANKLIKKKLTKKQREKLTKIRKKVIKGDDSYKRYVKKGKVIPTRKKFHDEILKKLFSKKRIRKNKDPDLYIFGGVPASGKTTVLGTKVPEKAIIINSDDFKTALSKKSKSPIKGYKLAHAGLLHEESDILVERAIRRALKEKRDVIFDATLGNYKKARLIINRFKRRGYDIHFLATQKSPSRTIVHASKRFIAKGRFVPPEYIRTKGNQMSKNSWRARKLGDTYQVYDVNNFPKSRLVSKSRKRITHNFRNPKRKKR